MELLAQQLDNCVRYPISKMQKELDNLVEKTADKYESIQVLFDLYLIGDGIDNCRKI